MTTSFERRMRKLFGVRSKADVAADLARQMDTDADRPLDVGNRRDTAPKHPLDIATGDEPLNDNDGSSPTGAVTRHLSELADLLVTSAKGQLSKADALHWLMFTQPGRTLVTRHAALHKRATQRKDQTTMKYDPDLKSKIVKQYGIHAFAKSVEKGDVAVSEHELTKLISEHAERHNTTFEKLFTAQTEEGVTLRKAIRVARDANWAKAQQGLMPTRPRVSDETAEAVNTGGEAYQNLVELAEAMHAASPEKTVAQHFADIYQNPDSQRKALREIAQARSRVPLNNTPEKAYDAFVEKAEELRKADPSLTEAQAFSKVYCAPANAELAKRERAENRPRA